jgi:hypothetical protein
MDLDENAQELEYGSLTERQKYIFNMELDRTEGKGFLICGL